MIVRTFSRKMPVIAFSAACIALAVLWPGWKNALSAYGNYQWTACPAFTSAMVDAAWLAVDYSQTEPPAGEASIDPDTFDVQCQLETDAGNTFFVSVGGGVELAGYGVVRDFSNNRKKIETILRTFIPETTPKDEAACRNEVLWSFVWQHYCRPKLPAPTE